MIIRRERDAFLATIRRLARCSHSPGTYMHTYVSFLRLVVSFHSIQLTVVYVHITRGASKSSTANTSHHFIVHYVAVQCRMAWLHDLT